MKNKYDDLLTVIESRKIIAFGCGNFFKKFLLRYPEFSEANAVDILRFEVGKVFEQVLCDAGVFKRTEKGISDFIRFTEVL